MVPQGWKRALITPIRKPGKPPETVHSYRPISLTSHVGKVFESMLLRRMTHMAEDASSPVAGLDATQAGYRRLRGAEEQVTYFTQQCMQVKRARRYGVVLSIDMDKAFDRVSRAKVLETLRRMRFPAKYCDWVEDYLRDREAAVSIDGVKGSYFDFVQGVPQGTVLSPFLFNVVMDEIAGKVRNIPGAVVTLYADDVAVLVSGESPQEAAHLAQTALHVIEDAAAANNLRISHDKTVCMFVCSSHLRGALLGGDLPSVRCSDGTRLKWTATLKYLGMTLDEGCTFAAHADDVRARFVKRLAVLYALAGTTWGCSAHTLRMVYLTYALPVVLYGVGVYGTACTAERLGQLDLLHKTAARIITGCPRTTATEVLLWEAQLHSLEY